MTSIAVILAVLLNLSSGWQIMGLLHCRSLGGTSWVVRLPVAYLTGQLFTGMVCLILLLAQIPFALFSSVILVFLLNVSRWLLQRKHRHGQSLDQDIPSRPMKITPGYWIAGLIGLCVLLITWALSWLGQEAPYGLWDAAAMWNLRVVYLVEGLDTWDFILTASTSHPDYPLLHSLGGAWLCGLTGQWQPTVTRWFAFAHAVMTLSMLVGLLLRRVHWSAALMAGFLLLATDFWWGTTYWQNADHTLGCYMMASAVVFCVWLDADAKKPCFTGCLLLMGLLTAACAWTKNDGAPWWVWMSLLVGVYLYRIKGCAACKPALMWLGISCCVLWMPLAMHMMAEQTNDLVAGVSGTAVMDRLFSLQRAQSILACHASLAAKLFPGWGCLFAAAWLISYRPWKSLGARASGYMLLLLVVLQLLTYMLVYQLTPYDLQWHLLSSANRLLLQVWPVFLLACFLLACESDTLQNQHAI